jgi:hypothetical protein
LRSQKACEGWIPGFATSIPFLVTLYSASYVTEVMSEQLLTVINSALLTCPQFMYDLLS